MATKAGFGARAATGARSAMRIIKKYPNRRLYDTATSGYITLADVKQMVVENTPFQVRDAKTNEELTRAILLQIILEEEAAGVPMFSNEMLAQMIRFYGGAMQGVVGGLFEQNVRAFMDFQKKMAEQGGAMLGGTGGDPSKVGSEVWQQFMQMQAPAMQGVMGNYLEQSSKMFLDMQQKMQESTKQFFPGFQFPGFPGGEKK
ncbi:polyhydroxyalkanoate synthesis repressor PhaR [Casimicrobium huifangae]|jgi:polyhydroxyalkanoate synthesis repressor PhaR|uniref:polyhydroxyalkanoate synthesis repressor PhaR n=1 Tax=Casimicrobium huifangae TaxID=2591109 RepID=UPI0012EB5577|nr:polyhydroxyalkanoate synthesis repressor PhaR [Casimicrobium huifangae]HQA32616.1 polyhydroxyalkanoate synthesis repressor PhaR [Casimicrobium huifangae]